MIKEEKIQTYDLATERVYRDGDTYMLKSNPKIRFYADEGRVTVEGAGSFELESPHRVTTHLVAQNAGARRVMGPHHDTKAHSKWKKVQKRIRALVSYAGDSFTGFK